jgi:hypothetical protein
MGTAGQPDEGGGGDSATSRTQRAFPVGSNDFVNNYYLVTWSRQFATQDYVPNRKILTVNFYSFLQIPATHSSSIKKYENKTIQRYIVWQSS